MRTLHHISTTGSFSVEIHKKDKKTFIPFKSVGPSGRTGKTEIENLDLILLIF